MQMVKDKFRALVCLLLWTTIRLSFSFTASGGQSYRSQNSLLFSTKSQKLVTDFVTEVERAIQDENFISLTLQGEKRKKSNTPEDAELLRGSIRQVQGRLIFVQGKSKKRQVLLQLTLKYHGATDICKNIKVQDVSERLPKLILDPLESEWGMEAVQSKPIRRAELKTQTNVWDLQISSSKLVRRKTARADANKATQPTSHDREKNVPLSKKADFFQALGLTKPDGNPRPQMKAKLRQCQKFVEIVGGLVEKVDNDFSYQKNKAISVVDMGCGRGYLTFALHSYLAENYHSVSTRGIDVRPKLVKEISSIATSLGDHFDTLSFETLSIEAFVKGETRTEDNDDESLSILIALHACDTATDDALWAGIRSNTDLIIVAPCCHKQIRAQLDIHYVNQSHSHPFADILKHGVYRERHSETVTDSLRALLLEFAGYKVQVFEFIGGEHTSKNVMITAVKKKDNASTAPILERIKALAEIHGIQEQKLAKWMDINLLGIAHKRPARFPNQMPP